MACVAGCPRHGLGMEDDRISSMPTYSSTPFWKDLIREAPGRFTYCVGETDSLLARTASARRQVGISGFGRLYFGQFHHPIDGSACSDSQSGRDCTRNDILRAALRNPGAASWAFGTHLACANHLDDRILERRDKVHYPDPRLGALKT